MNKIEFAQNNLLSNDKKNKIAYFFKSLSDETRIAIIFSLKDNELTVTELKTVLNMTQSAVSHQLKTLRDANIVTNRREGKEVYYKLSDQHIYTIFNQALDHVEEKLNEK